MTIPKNGNYWVSFCLYFYHFRLSTHNEWMLKDHYALTLWTAVAVWFGYFYIKLWHELFSYKCNVAQIISAIFVSFVLVFSNEVSNINKCVQLTDIHNSLISPLSILSIVLPCHDDINSYMMTSWHGNVCHNTGTVCEGIHRRPSCDITVMNSVFMPITIISRV